MDPVTMNALIQGGVSLLISVLGFIVYHKWILPGSAPVAPAGPAPVPAVTGHPVLDLIGSALADILKTHATSAVKGGLASMIGPALLKIAQEFAASAASNTAPPANPTASK